MATPKFREMHRTRLALLMAAAVTLSFGPLHLAGKLGRLENTAYDWRFRLLARPGLASRDVVIIGLDNASFSSREMRQNFGRWPWNRALYAQLLWYLRQAPARAIGIDITFQGRDEHAGGDELFAGELAKKPDTVLAFSLHTAEITYAQGAAATDYPDLRRNAWTARNAECGPETVYTGLEMSLYDLISRARGLGGINRQPDSDGVLRSAPLFFRYAGAYYPALSLAVAEPFLDANAAGRGAGGDRAVEFRCGRSLRIGRREIPMSGPQAQAPIYWYGPEFRTFRHYPVWQIFDSAVALYNQEKPRVSPAEFRDKIVLIGATANSLGDFTPTPFSSVHPGVELHATLISNLLQEHFVHPAGNAWTLLAIVLMAGVASLAVWQFSDWRAYTAAALGLAAGYAGLNFLLFYTQRISLVMVAPLAALFTTYVAGNVTRYVTEGREKRRYRSTLMKYVAPQIVEAIMQDGRLGELHNEKRDLTVLFSDIRGFTSISEKIPVNDLVATLNEFLNAMVEVIFEHGGTLDKFVGDCVMAFWGAPLRQENHAELASRAALRMQATLEGLNQHWKQQGRPELKIGVGLNSGEVIFGNIGSQRRMDFTVIGDNVNLASRLESSTKELKASIVISEATYRRIADRAEVRDLGTIHVKGKDAPIRVYELLGMSGKEQENRAKEQVSA